LLYLLDEAEPYLFLRASKNPHPKLIGRITVKVGEGITGWVAENAEPVAVSRNANKDPRFKVFNNLPEDRYEAFLSAPIVANPDRVIGVINVQHRKTHRHSEREQTLISIIGHQVGGAIENARLYEGARRREQQLSTLSQVSQIVASGRYLDEMLQLIVNMIAETMQARVCSIMLVDKKKNELVLKAAKCSSEEYWQRPNLKIGKSLVSRVVKQGKPLMVKDVTTEEGYRYPELAKKEGVRSLLSVPMITRERSAASSTSTRTKKRCFRKPISACCPPSVIRRPLPSKTRSWRLSSRSGRKRSSPGRRLSVPRAFSRNNQAFPKMRPIGGYGSRA
jgi:signal transduction protein with GAF and PtsI domain